MEFSTLTIDGTDYSLAWDFNDIADAEPVAGCNLLGAIFNVPGATATQLRGLLYAALRQKHSGVTLQEAGAMIRADLLSPILTALSEAYMLAMPVEARGKFTGEEAATSE